MPTRNVVLTDHHEKLITDLLVSGRYQNASEILRDGLRLVEERNAKEAAKLEALRAAALVGFDAMECGAYRDFGSFEEFGEYLTTATDKVITGTAAGN